MVEAGGVGILSLIDKAQLIDFNKRVKRQNQRIRQSEVHGGYMGFRKRGIVNSTEVLSASPAAKLGRRPSISFDWVDGP